MTKDSNQDNKIAPNQTIAGKGIVAREIKSKSRHLGVLVLLLPALIIGVSLYAFTRPACGDEDIKDASIAFNYNDHKRINELGKEFDGARNASTSADCMYVVTKYYINNSDSNKAKQSLENFTLAHDKKPVNEELTKTGGSISLLEQNVEFLVSNSKESDDTARKLSR